MVKKYVWFRLVQPHIALLIILFMIFSEALFAFNPFLKNHVYSKELVVLVTSYNNEKFLYQNLNSIVHQKLSIPFRVIYVNDCSTDKTAQLVDSYMQEYNFTNFCMVIHNERRLGALANQHKVIHTLPDHVIVVQVDGDDFLAHDGVLERVLQEYSNENIWLTYGQMLYYPEGYDAGLLCEKFPDWVLEQNSFRSYRWISSHLKTFYAGLFKRIKKEDLLFQGNFFPMAVDHAFMFPMLEMASRGHIAFIPDVLYMYNHHNPLGCHFRSLDLQKVFGRLVRSMPKYGPILPD